jgi:hypothetical protein
MKSNQNSPFIGFGVVLCLFLFGGNSSAADMIRTTTAAVDRAAVSESRITRDSPLHVQLFDAIHADLGNPKHRDTAELLARSAPHLLAVDIVESLRDAGFSNVVLDEETATSSQKNLTLTGSFTDLNPGSQAARAWIGFGAGKSKVCVEGRVSDSGGEVLAEFSHCRKGLGWGDSSAQMANSAVRVGDSIAIFLTEWANGDYAR